MKTGDESQVLKDLQRMPNVGPAMARDLVLLGYRSVEELRGQDPQEMYDRLCALTSSRQDPCVLDTFCAVVDYAETGVPRPWWEFSRLRKSNSARS